MQDLTDQELVTALFRRLNILGGDRSFIDEITKQLVNEHRTVQQAFFRTMNNVMINYADSGCGHDQRNEEAMMFAKEVKRLDYYFPLV